MSDWHRGLPASAGLDRLAARVEDDPQVLTVVLTGSTGRGIVTTGADVDLILVVERGELGWSRRSSGGLDVQSVTLERLRHIPWDPSHWWDRYQYCHTQLLLDRSAGVVPRLVQSWARLSPAEVRASIDFYIDGYLHYTYRSLKEHRDGCRQAARLDGCEALPWALSLLYAVHGRVRPWNRYLLWELAHHPLPGEAGDAACVGRMVTDILDRGCPEAHRGLFAIIEPAARRHGFGGVIDGFIEGTALLRSP